MSPTDFALFVALLTRRREHAWSFEALPPCSDLLGVGTGLGYKLNGVSNIHMFPSLSFRSRSTLRSFSFGSQLILFLPPIPMCRRRTSTIFKAGF